MLSRPLKKLLLEKMGATAGLSSSASFFAENTAGQASSGTRLFQRTIGRLHMSSLLGGRSVRRRRGSTLIEVAFASLLVGVMLVASMDSVGAIFKTRLVAYQRQQGANLAHELMAEILRAYYEDPSLPPGSTGLEAGETGDGSRTLWDDVDDYDGLTTSPPEEQDGSVLPNTTGWTRQVTLTYPAAEEKLITVDVTSPSSETFTVAAKRSRWGALELVPPNNRTYVAGLTGTLQIATVGGTATGAATVVNHAQDE